MSEIQNLLYQNWLRRLAVLKAENAKQDWTLEGQARHDLAYAEAKQAYWLLCDDDPDLSLYHAGNEQVYASSTGTQNASK